jgi:hypothetical protein
VQQSSATSCVQVFVEVSQRSMVQASVSAQSASVTQQPWTADRVHLPVAPGAPHDSVVHGFPSSQLTVGPQQNDFSVCVQVPSTHTSSVQVVWSAQSSFVVQQPVFRELRHSLVARSHSSTVQESLSAHSAFD